MFKSLVVSFLILLTIQSNAKAEICEEASNLINTKNLFAQVISRSHLDLELVIVRKGVTYYKDFLKVQGGKGFKPSTVPTCNQNNSVSLNWLSDTIASVKTFDYDGQTTTYRLCQYDINNELVAQSTICNFATGD